MMDEMDQLSKVHSTGLMSPERAWVKRRSTSKIFALRSASDFLTVTRFEFSDRFLCQSF